jgi:hypothetical protein
MSAVRRDNIREMLADLKLPGAILVRQKCAIYVRHPQKPARVCLPHHLLKT